MPPLFTPISGAQDGTCGMARPDPKGLPAPSRGGRAEAMRKDRKVTWWFGGHSSRLGLRSCWLSLQQARNPPLEQDLGEEHPKRCFPLRSHLRCYGTWARVQRGCLVESIWGPVRPENKLRNLGRVFTLGLSLESAAGCAGPALKLLALIQANEPPK